MSPTDTDQVFEDLLALADDQRREYLRSNQQLLDRSLGERLLAEALRQLEVDLQQAGKLASTALSLAEELDNDYLRGRSQRMLANVSNNQGHQRAAAQLYESALTSFQRIGDEREDAITRSSAILNLIYFGEYQRAFEWAESARNTFEKLGDRLRLARLDLNLANILFRQDQWEEAAERYENAYLEFRRLGNPTDVAISLANMAVCHSSLNNFRQALVIYDRARSFCEKNTLPVMVSEIDYNIAYLHYLRGEYTKAMELYQNTRKSSENIGNRFIMALCDLDQSEIFLELNLIAEAAKLAQRAFDTFEELGTQYERAKALAFLAIAVSRTGKNFLALELLGGARDLFVREDNQIWQAMIDLYQSLVLYRAGRPLEAARFAKSALEEFSTSPFPARAAMCEILLARLHYENGAYELARKFCNDAVRRLKKIDTSGLRHQAYFVLGQIEEAAGDLESAYRAYRRSQSTLEQLRSHLQVEELKIGFLEDRLSVYERLVWLTLRRGAATEEKEAIFTYIERAKSRSLADLMGFRAHALPPTSAARSDQAEQIRKLREELNWYYRQIDLQEMRRDDRGREGITQLLQVSRQQEDHLIRSLRQLQTKDQEYGSLQAAATIDLQDICSVLPEDTALIEYYFTRGLIYCCILSGKTLEITAVSVVSRVKEIHRQLQFQLSKCRLGQDYVAEFGPLIHEATKAQLHFLYNELVAPVNHLLDKKNLIVVPHGFLHYVPFHALFDGCRFLLDRFTISYAPSASVYYLCQVKKTKPRNEVLVMGVFDDEMHHLRSEVHAVADIFSSSRLFTGEQASEQVLKRYGNESSILYLATHKFHRRDNPMFSSIQLGTSELFVFNLYNLKIQADIVVLSGCGSNLNGIESPEELVAMTRGVLYAGAQSALVTLWDAQDQSATLFMRSFFREVKKGSSRASALQEAMIEVRTRYPHPYHWAPYVLVGKPDGVARHPR